jgi:hypothetical protein
VWGVVKKVVLNRRRRSAVKNTVLCLCVALGVCTSALWAQGATIDLYEYAFNIDGAVSDSFLSDMSGFGLMANLGTINISINGPGSHYVAAYFDYEITDYGVPGNPWNNEYGAAVNENQMKPGQSWEIGTPEFSDPPSTTDIYAHFSGINTLINGNSVLSPNDVAMAMGWDFVLGVGETANISFCLDQLGTISSFYLSHTDADSPESILFSSTLDIRGGGVPVPDVCSTFALLAFVMAGVTGLRMKIRG